MMKLNNEMVRYILSMEINDKTIDKNVVDFAELVFTKIKLINDMIIVVDIKNEMEKEDLDYNSILKQYGDYTGFEASYNEMRVMDYIDIGNANPANMLLKITNELKVYLNKLFPQYSFTIIGSINKGQVSLRFHMLRQDEIGWIRANRLGILGLGVGCPDSPKRHVTE